jgi:hypothetical protein
VTKSAQAAENKAETRNSKYKMEKRRERLGPPPGIWKDEKTNELQKEGFVCC